MAANTNFQHSLGTLVKFKSQTGILQQCLLLWDLQGPLQGQFFSLPPAGVGIHVDSGSQLFHSKKINNNNNNSQPNSVLSMCQVLF